MGISHRIFHKEPGEVVTHGFAKLHDKIYASTHRTNMAAYRNNVTWLVWLTWVI